jgi:hypothetical protein
MSTKSCSSVSAPGAPGQDGGHLLAAGELRLRQGGIEQAAAGVGVDLDQLRAVLAEVEVVAHEDAGRGRRMAGRSGAQASTRSAQAGSATTRSTAATSSAMRCDAGLAEEHRRLGEEMRAASSISRTMSAPASPCASARRSLSRSTLTHWQSRLRVSARRLHFRGIAGSCDSGADSPASKNATTRPTSRRRIGGSERQTRLP